MFKIEETDKIASSIKDLYSRLLGISFGALTITSAEITIGSRNKISVRFLQEGGPFPVTIARFTLIQQENCCGVMVSTDTWVNERSRGHGLAQNLMTLKEDIAKAFGYSSLCATVNVSSNQAETHILEKFGWLRGYSFTNKRTGNTVAFYHKSL